MFNPNTMEHPYSMRVSKDGTSTLSKTRAVLEPMVKDLIPDFGEALEARVNEDPAQRVKEHQVLRVAYGAAKMGQLAAEVKWQDALEAGHTENRTVMANIADFITQEVHRSLDVWLRLIATRLVSVQPMTQLQGKFFFDTHRGHPNTVNEFDLTDVSAFDPTFGDLEEGGPVDSVGIGLTDENVEAKWKALKSAVTWQSQVKLMTEHGLNARDWSDSTAAHVLAQIVDSDIINALIAFAETNPRGPIHFDPQATNWDGDGGTYETMTPDQQQAWDRKFVREVLSRIDTEMYADRYVRASYYLAGTNVVQLLARTPDALATEDGNRAFDQEVVKGSQITSHHMRTGATVFHDPAIDPDIMVAGHVSPMNPFWAGMIFGSVGAASLATAWFMDPDTLVDKRARAIAYAFLGIRASQFRIARLTDEAEPT